MAVQPNQQELYYYRVIADSEVAPEKREEAERALKICLELHPVPFDIKIDWVRMVPENEIDRAEAQRDFEQTLRVLLKFDLKVWTGIAGPNNIFKEALPFYGMTGNTKLKNRVLISEEVSLPRVIYTIAHEFRHVLDFWLFGEDYWPGSSEEIRRLEERADNFAQFILERYGRYK